MAKLSFTGFENHAFLPYPAINEVSESFEFLTDTVNTHDGSMDCTAVRSAARQSFKYDLSANLLRRQNVFNLGEQNLRGDWALPLWSEAQYVGALSAGTSVTCDTTISDFRAGNLVLAYFSDDYWQLKQIATVGDTGITVTTPFQAMQSAVLVPVNKGRVRGDIGHRMKGQNSTFEVLYEVLEPKRHPTKLAVLFALDVSGSMEGERLELARSSLYETVLALKGSVVNSGVRLDLSLCFWSTSTVEHTWLDADEADCDAALAIIQAQGTTGGTNPLLAFQRANAFFGTDTPNPGDRKDMMFFITDAAASTTTSREEALEMITRVEPYAGRRSVDIYAINMDTTDINEALKVDNASGGNITNVTSANPLAMIDRFYGALVPEIGYQFDGYEILTTEPTTSGDEVDKGIQKQEDRVDFGGVVSVRSPWLQSRTFISHPFIFEGLREVNWFKKWLYRRHGRARKFLLPTFQHDIAFTELNTALTIGQISANDIDAYDENRRRIVIRYVDGTWQGNRITDVEPNILGGYQITLERALRQPLDRVAQISYAGVARLLSDRVEISWTGDQAVEVTLGIVEISK